MDFVDRIHELSTRISKNIENIKTEEATKTALIMPFINALGYDVFNPSEVVPEFTSDVGTKKGEKVDYAIFKDDKPIMLIECKCCENDLNIEHASQLFRYFQVTETRFGVLTNGVIYRFYSDIEKSNIMDSKPFFEINVLDLNESQIEELKKFTKSSFDLDNILTTASELKYTKEIKRILSEQLSNPSEEFVKLFAKQVYSGLITKNVKEQFANITKSAFLQFINEKINDRLKSALKEETLETSEEKEEIQPESKADGKQDSKIITTEEEIEGYHIVKAILSEIIDPTRVAIRDTIYYCGIILDDNNRKPICRLYFNTKQKCLGFFDENKNEEKIAIDNINDIYKYSERLKQTILYYNK
ncbi:MAG: type I restriction enzyme HsdR N-terminal domain-containing protein [Candidatus Latescibacteria bacterium]|nr:type I restriction enzyme HsdR N-terminal domain-containing protein [Candidatus Latescibacterota bacterium]